MKMSFIHYSGFKPTSHYIGLIWWGRAIIGIETTPDSFGIIIAGYWMGWAKDD